MHQAASHGAALTVTAIFMLALSYATGFATLPTELERTQRCHLERTYKMIGYNCANLNLKEIPQWLKTNLEILDLSFNRIRDLNGQSFARYGSVKYLYLFENMIQNIEEGTFSELTNLEAIDLSFNALKSVPLEIFQLPVLRNLYVGHNALYDLEADLSALQKPVKAPLQVLSFPDCRLQRLPDFGILPDLWQLNISSNPMKELTLYQFSPMCNLKSVDLNNTQVPSCACQVLTSELILRGTTVKYPPLSCIPMTVTEQDRCKADFQSKSEKMSEEEFYAYQQCMDVRKSRKLDTEAKATWMTISGVVALCIVLFAIILYCLHRRNARKMKASRRNKKQQVMNNINRVIVPPSPAPEVPVETTKSEKLLSDCD
uniref:LRRCT domain-containing protein n=1 Tax=Anopheles atroparvus TaxID=41427 RepID=A0A182IJJ4_ANOAO